MTDPSLDEIISTDNINTEDLVERIYKKNSEKIDKGGYGSIYKLDKKWCAKIVRYSKDKLYKSPDNPDRPENAEIKMLDLLCKEFNKDVPHVMTYKYSDTFLKDGKFHRLFLMPFIPNCDLEEFIENKLDDYVNEITEREIDNEENEVELTEEQEKLLAKKTNSLFKVIFFQILMFLAQIQKVYPNFRHNDLKPNNVLVYPLKDKISEHHYTFDGYKYKVPNLGFRLRVWDFDFSIIDGKIMNDKVMSGYLSYIGVRQNQNQYYDIHTFINTLLFDNDYDLDEETLNFVKYTIPEKYHGEKGPCLEDCRLLPNIEYTTASKLLEHPYFNEFRNKPLELNLISKERPPIENVVTDIKLVKDPIIRKFFIWLRKIIRSNIINATDSQHNEIFNKTAEIYKDISKNTGIKGHELMFVILQRVELAVTKINQLDFEHFVDSGAMQGPSEIRMLDIHKKISMDLFTKYGV